MTYFFERIAEMSAVTVPQLAQAIYRAMQLADAQAENVSFEWWSRLHPEKSDAIVVETTSKKGNTQKFIVDIRPVRTWNDD